MAKRALLVGINAYRSPINPLRGCRNDVQQMRHILLERDGFQTDSISLLVDEDATRARIIAGLGWLVSETEPGDVLVFHYAGHGSYVDDPEGDEWDCRDEILVPHDHDWLTPLRDDNLKRLFDTVPPGANLTFISDCCHSGTLNKLPTLATVPRSVLPPPEIERRIALQVARRDADLKAFVAAEYRRMAQEISPEDVSARLAPCLEQARDAFKRERYHVVETRENNILLAACRDDQVSVDAFIDGDWHGAFTYHLVRAITEVDGILTYAQLIDRAGKAMERFAQIPQLECPASLKGLPIFAPFPEQVLSNGF